MTIVGTLSIVAGALACVVFGAAMLAQRADGQPAPEAAEKTPVAVERVAFEDGYTTGRRFIGQIESGTQAALSFELSGRLAYLAVEEGDSVDEGQVVARLDTALLEAEEGRLSASRAAILAQLGFAETRLIRARDLRDEGFSSQETLDQALANRDELQSRIAEVDAALNTVRINLEKSVMLAPFDGRVGAQTVEITETLSPGQMVLTLVDAQAVGAGGVAAGRVGRCAWCGAGRNRRPDARRDPAPGPAGC
ncbi:efflux RND transporter periplasmic adaptor subunit [Sulfitobacter sp. S190]|uniref:efflux RND transporter periplasmic adaptor subunit n=1 Tax=Sulfitobacter sp. S190 TaxID=2867022 RepID=UPI0021A55A2C|nr:efflux RND transporter periplasmic adaptor subunit [Sulfitobacter sp. S190]